MTKTLFKSLFILFVGASLGFAVKHFQGGTALSTNKHETQDEKPLYWVAPMDDNYRRDQPGKSPMGMDLIPVYKEANATDLHGPGTIKIAPQVINNLGVRVTQALSEKLSSEISTVGYVQYDEDRLIHIHPRIDGWVEKLYIKAAGNPVRKGQPLYTLYSPELVNSQEELLLALKRNNNSLIRAARNRMKALHLSREFIEQLEKDRQVKQTITFYAPQDGVVSELKIREGFYVNPGNTLLSIAQLDQVWVEAEVFERDAAMIKAGLKVSMYLDYLPGKQWQGIVDYVYPSLNSKTRTLRVRLKFDNQDLSLKPNMFAQISIYTEQTNSSIIVPKESVIRSGKQDRVVLALGDGQFKSVEVKLGRVLQNKIEIFSGINAGDSIVSSAHFLLDSESSKTSDFLRMRPMPEAEYQQATVKGLIHQIDNKNRSLDISREAIEKWGRDAARMNFLVADNIDLSKFSANQTVTFTFEVRDDLVITELNHNLESNQETLQETDQEANQNPAKENM